MALRSFEPNPPGTRNGQELSEYCVDAEDLVGDCTVNRLDYEYSPGDPPSEEDVANRRKKIILDLDRDFRLDPESYPILLAAYNNGTYEQALRRAVRENEDW